MAFGQFGNGGVSTSAFKVPIGRPRSIIAQALAGHPNWRGVPGAGVGRAGSGILGAGSLTALPGSGSMGITSGDHFGNGGPPPTGSPLDATYFNNVANNQFQTNNRINALQRSDANNLTALQAALGNLAYQQPRDQLGLEQRANQTGGLYSSVEDQNQSNLARSYFGRQTAAQTGYGQQHSAIASQIAALLGGEPIYETGQAIDAANRAAALAQANPALGAPVAPAPAAPSGGGRVGVGSRRGQGRATGAGSSLLNFGRNLERRR